MRRSSHGRGCASETGRPCAERGAIRLGDEQKMSGGNVFGACVLDQRLGHALARVLRLREQTRPGRRRERRHAHELRVVAQSCLRVGARPAPVEDELAPRIALAVERQRGFEFAVRGLQQQMARHPSGAFADASGWLERQQEFVTHERIAGQIGRIRQGIPVLRRNGGDRIDNAQRHFSACSQRRAGPDICPHRALPCSRCRRR